MKMFWVTGSVADPDPGSGIRCFFDPWIRDGFFPDPRSRIPDPDHCFVSLFTKFFCKNSLFYLYNLIILYTCLKNVFYNENFID